MSTAKKLVLVSLFQSLMLVTEVSPMAQDCTSGSLYEDEIDGRGSVDRGYWYLNLEFPSSCSGRVSEYEVTYFSFSGTSQVHSADVALWAPGTVEGVYDIIVKKRKKDLSFMITHWCFIF